VSALLALSIVLFCSAFHSQALYRSYLSIHRRNQTYCLLCPSSWTIAQVKHEVAAAVSQHGREVADGEVRLLQPATQAVLNDSESMQDYADETFLYLVLAVGDDEYETVDVQAMESPDR
jgi:hypothetical protein